MRIQLKWRAICSTVILQINEWRDIVMTTSSKKKVQIQVNRELSEEAEAIFQELGLSTTTAITAYYKRVVAEGGLPFKLELSAREIAVLQFKNAEKGLPVTDKIETKKQLDKWLSEGDEEDDETK